jgi:hypothetical protein
MAINPLDSSSNYVSQVQPQPQPYAERVAAKENDNKAAEEAHRAASASEALKPTVNTQGQTVGTLVNVKA